MAAFIQFARSRLHFGLGELAYGFLQEQLFFRQLQVHSDYLSLSSYSSGTSSSGTSCVRISPWSASSASSTPATASASSVWPSSSNSPTLSESARSRMLMPCRSPMRRRRALSSASLRRSLPARRGSSELEAEPEDGSPLREEPRLGLVFGAVLRFSLLGLLLDRGAFFLATVFAVFFALFFGALRFLAMVMNLFAAGSFMLRESRKKQNQ